MLPMNSQDMPPEARIWQLGLGFANTAVLYNLVKLGVIEQMRQHPQSLTALGEACGLNPDILYRVLRYATVIGVIGYENSQYFLTETGKLLRKDVPGSFYLGIMLFGSAPWLDSWQHLEDSLVTGRIAFEQAMSSSFFTYLDNHAEINSTFNQWMTVSTVQAAQAITGAYDFTPFSSVCDIGGGQGILLKQILAVNPNLRGILYDLEPAVKGHILADMDGRVEIQTGSFFERVPSADVLLMKSVLHDWSDEKCLVNLGHCRQVMQPSSRLLIVDRVIASPPDVMSSFMDLHMHVMSGGRERTESDFNLLLHHAGMKLNRVIPTKSAWKVIEATTG